jgi:hypothetical protein
MRARPVLVAAGVVLMGYAVAGALTDPGVDPAGVLFFLAGVLVAHDVAWMAVTLAAGAVITGLVPARHRAVARAAAISAAAVTVVALPLVPGLGRSVSRDLAVVLLLVAVAAALSAVRKKSERPGEGSP